MNNAEEWLGIEKGTIRATVLIETIHAVFEMKEILFQLKDYAAGLNCGRWDYIFSYIKTFPDLLIPDRSVVGMDQPFLQAYSKLLISTCHECGVHAMGGMSAFIPIKGNDDANAAAMEKVRQDKLTEVKNGHDGTWVAHPGMIPLVYEVFNEHMPTPNQINKRLEYTTTPEQLLELPKGETTENQLRTNISVTIEYIDNWLNGRGAVAINNLMEDAATAEISRTQIWQQIKGNVFTKKKVEDLIMEETKGKGLKKDSVELFENLVFSEELPDFLTLEAYKKI